MQAMQKSVVEPETRPLLMSAAEVSEILGIDRQSLYTHGHNGAVPGLKKIGSRVYFVRAKIDAYVKSLAK